MHDSHLQMEVKGEVYKLHPGHIPVQFYFHYLYLKMAMMIFYKRMNKPLRKITRALALIAFSEKVLLGFNFIILRWS